MARLYAASFYVQKVVMTETSPMNINGRGGANFGWVWDSDFKAGFAAFCFCLVSTAQVS